ncbi:MAG: 30S ribosomal protein S17 [Deltaproteobacteria bacterium]|nr:30S ribosomal protein S17 [Deltaproteobacteria bacterium]
MTAAKPGQPTPEGTKERGRRRRLVGRVVNETQTEGRVQQTIVVEVIRRARDPFYGKYVKRKKKFHAHDEANEYRKNDVGRRRYNDDPDRNTTGCGR